MCYMYVCMYVCINSRDLSRDFSRNLSSIKCISINYALHSHAFNILFIYNNKYLKNIYNI